MSTTPAAFTNYGPLVRHLEGTPLMVLAIILLILNIVFFVHMLKGKP
jgi:hypothetical protein